MAHDLKSLTDSPSNLTHLDVSGVGLGIAVAELAAHLLRHPVRSDSCVLDSRHSFVVFEFYLENTIYRFWAPSHAQSLNRCPRCGFSTSEEIQSVMMARPLSAPV